MVSLSYHTPFTRVVDFLQLACDVVFDAVSDGQGGIVDYALCDEG